MLYKCISYTHPSDKLAHTNMRRRWNLLVIVVLAEELTLMVTYLLTAPLSPKSLCRTEIKPCSLFPKDPSEWPAPDHLQKMHLWPEGISPVCAVPSFLQRHNSQSLLVEVNLSIISSYTTALYSLCCHFWYLKSFSLLLTVPKVRRRRWDKEQSWICRK